MQCSFSALAMAFVFFFMLALIWYSTKCFRRRMEEPDFATRPVSTPRFVVITSVGIEISQLLRVRDPEEVHGTKKKFR